MHIGILINKAKEETETKPVIVDTKISNCSM